MDHGAAEPFSFALWAVVFAALVGVPLVLAKEFIRLLETRMFQGRELRLLWFRWDFRPPAGDPVTLEELRSLAGRKGQEPAARFTSEGGVRDRTPYDPRAGGRES